MFENKNFWIGVLAGVATTAIIKTPGFRKGCAKIIAGGLQLKDEASEFFESVKEDAEDEKAELAAKSKA